MASRVRTRISFGAFANFKNNLQNQIGLNTIITSIKKLISTYNNNFAYIVNSFNLFLQIKYGKDPILIEDKESKTNNITFQPESDTAINYTEMLDKIEQLNKRVDNIEKIMNSGEAAALVTPGITFYFKNPNIGYLGGNWYPNSDIIIQYNYNGYWGTVNPTTIYNKIPNTDLCYEIGVDFIEQVYSNSIRRVIQFASCGVRYSLGNNKFYSNDIQVIKGTVNEISLGNFTLYQYYSAGPDNRYIESGSAEIIMRLDGTIEEFDESYKELKNGETINI